MIGLQAGLAVHDVETATLVNGHISLNEVADEGGAAFPQGEAAAGAVAGTGRTAGPVVLEGVAGQGDGFALPDRECPTQGRAAIGRGSGVAEEVALLHRHVPAAKDTHPAALAIVGRGRQVVGKGRIADQTRRSVQERAAAVGPGVGGAGQVAADDIAHQGDGGGEDRQTAPGVVLACPHRCPTQAGGVAAGDVEAIHGDSDRPGDDEAAAQTARVNRAGVVRG